MCIVMMLMISKSIQAPANTAVNDEPTLTDQELRRLAQFLNVLMEVDFYLNRKLQEITND